MKAIINTILKPFKKQICIECGRIIDRGFGNYKNYCKTCKMRQYRRMRAIKNERKDERNRKI
jgi:predicted  nucleic acid-binding Zn-ribbon protein